MRVRVRVPVTSVTILLEDVSLDDISALIAVLDPDRNHHVRGALYDELKRAQALLLPLNPQW